MKKLKANVVLASIIFGFSILVLCSFGVDAAYVILSRYKLQKVTESIALEYAASGIGTAETPQIQEDSCNEIQHVYKNVYKTLGSGVLAFDIEQIQYKTRNDSTSVKIITKSKVMPAFLRFVGVRSIMLHSRAYAISNPIMLEGKILKSPDENGTLSAENSFVEFEAPFFEDSNTANYIASKSAQNGDFEIEFKFSEDENNPDRNKDGGFFVLGGFEGPLNTGADSKQWSDLGKYTKTASKTQIEAGNQKFFCISSKSDKPVVFDLSDSDIKRINKIRIYKAQGSADLDEYGNYQNPCESGKTADKNNDFDYSKREAAIKLKILNNVSLIKGNVYNRFESEGTKSCQIRG